MSSNLGPLAYTQDYDNFGAQFFSPIHTTANPRLNLTKLPVGTIIDGGGLGMLIKAVNDDEAWVMSLIGDDAGEIKKWGPCAHIFSMPLERMQQTAEATLKSYGVEAPQNRYKVTMELADLTKVTLGVAANDYDEAEDKAKALMSNAAPYDTKQVWSDEDA